MRKKGGRSPHGSPSKACSCNLSEHSSPPHSPSGSPTHLRSMNASLPHHWGRSWSSSASSIYSCLTEKESHTGFGGGSDDEAGSHTGDASEHEEDEGFTGRGFAGKCSCPDDSRSEDGSDSEVSNPKGSGSKGEESGSKNEESGIMSSSSGSASESEEETPKAKPDGVPSEASSGSDSNALQTP